MVKQIDSDTIIKCNLCGKTQRLGNLLTEMLSTGFRLYCLCNDKIPIFYHYNRGRFADDVVTESAQNRAIIV